MTPFTRSTITPAVLLLVGLTGLTVPAAAQQPSQAQISAIRSSCRADFMAHCSGVQPGGRDALACLQKNVAALSSGCQQAVSAVSGAAAQKSGEAPTAAGAPTTAAAPAGATATAAAAPAGETSAGAAAPTAAERVAPPATSRPSAGAKSAAAVPTVPPPPLAPARPAMPLRMELALFGRACGGDVQVHCPGVRPGGGQILTCLAAHQAKLSPGCRRTLATARQSM